MNIIFSTIFRTVFASVLVGFSFSGNADNTIYVEDNNVHINEFSADELADLEGIAHVVITSTDADGNITETVIVTTSTDEASADTGEGPGTDPDDPDGYTKRGDDSVDSDVITITIPRSIRGPVILVADGQVIVVPTK